ncbi:MAG: hypothetical protein IPG92_11690 [Flavobacteriales bacterium]|nr:hypothetical protein [Flavobacteriales bacterium]
METSGCGVPPVATASVDDDCDNDQFTVDVNVISTGGPSRSAWITR